MFIKKRKAISPVIAVLLLLSITIVSAASFQTWFNTYSSAIYVKQETQSDDLNSIEIQKIIDDNIYIKNNLNENISVSKFQIGSNNCIRDQNLNLTSGMNTIDISSCNRHLAFEKEEILIQTNKGVFSTESYFKRSNYSSCLNMSEGNVLLLYLNESSGTVIDYSGQSNNGTPAAGVEFGYEGIIGDSLNLDGTTSDYVNFGDVELSSENISISLWFKLPSAISSESPLLAKYNAATASRAYSLVITATNRINFFVSEDGLSGSNYVTQNALTQPDVGEWYHVVAIFSTNGTVGMYINGEYENSTTQGTVNSIDNNAQALRLGYRQSGGNQYGDATIDEVSVWNKTLSEAEILNLYNHQNSGIKICSSS